MGRRLVVLYDGQCTMCRASQRIVSRVDWLRQVRWVPSQSPEAEQFGISREVLETTMVAISGPNRWSGFAAWKQILLRLPVLYLLIGATVWLSVWFVVAWLAFFAPFTAPIGERVYRWIAQNRHKVPGATCQRRL